MNTFSERIKSNGLTMAKVAKEAGINRSYLCLIFNGKKRPKYEVAVAIQMAVGGIISWSELVTIMPVGAKEKP